MPLYTPFAAQKNIGRSKLYSVKGLFELLHTDIADIRFSAKSAVESKYFLLFVNFFTSKIYTYPMKKITLLKKKTEISYDDISRKEKTTEK